MQESGKNEVNSSLTTGKAKGKVFYGWFVAIAASGVVFATCNLQYSFGVFFKPIINQFGWSRAAVSGSVSARSIVSGVLAPIAGTLSDKYGPRRVLLIGIFLSGLGYLLLSRSTTLWQFYLFISVLMGLGIGTIFTPLISTVTKWFGGKAALPNGILLSGFGFAQILLPPVATYLILQYDWETCVIVLGIAAWGLGTLAWSFIKSPSQSDLRPSIQEPAGAGHTSKSSKTQSPVQDDYTLSEALHTRTFWTIFLIHLVNALTYQMVIVHIVAAATDVGILAGAAAFILTLSGITNTVGRLTLGGLASKFGNKTVLAFSLAVQAPMLFLLAGAIDLWVFYVVVAAHGLVYGGVSPIIPTLTGSSFGTRSAGSILGTMTIAYTLGIAIGPLLAGYIFDVSGSYFIAFSIAATAAAIAFLLSLLLKPPTKKAPTP